MPTITKEELRHLYGHLEQLRAEEPVLWAVVVGRSTAPKIAMVLAIPTGMVEKDLELLVKQKVLKRMSGTVYIPSADGSIRGSQMDELKEIAGRLQAMQFEKYGDSVKELVPPNAKKLLQGVEVKGPVSKDALTAKQHELLELIRGTYPSHLYVFSAIDAARLMGLSRSGYMKNSLVALEKKGYLRSGTHDGKQRWWIIAKEVVLK